MLVTVLITVPVVGGIVLLVRARGKEHKARVEALAALQAAALTWPSATGTVVTNDVITRMAGASDQRYALYSALVTYRFQVGATVHTGTNIKAGEDAHAANRASWDRPEHAAALAARYPAGATVTVFYDPADPATRNCLER